MSAMKRILPVLLLFITSLLLAQPGDPTPGEPVPIPGLAILAALGVYLGVKKLRQQKNK
jgi:hypothetical protein